MRGGPREDGLISTQSIAVWLDRYESKAPKGYKVGNRPRGAGMCRDPCTGNLVREPALLARRQKLGAKASSASRRGHPQSRELHPVDGFRGLNRDAREPPMVHSDVAARSTFLDVSEPTRKPEISAGIVFPKQWRKSLNDNAPVAGIEGPDIVVLAENAVAHACGKCLSFRG